MPTAEQVKKNPLYSTLVVSLGQKAAFKYVSEAMEEAAKSNISETEFSDKTQKIIIPSSMNKKEASEELERQWEDEESIIDVRQSFDGYNWKDVLVAVKLVTEEHFGWISGKTVQSFFGSRRPMELEIVTDVVNGNDVTETCFYGNISVSAWEDAELSVGGNSISCEVKKRYSKNVKEYYAKISNHLKNKSIYRGKSITVTKQVDPWGNASLHFDIFELKVSSKIVLNDDIKRIIDNFIVDDLGENGKRCYLFSGKYGNAKTETAMQIGHVGKKKGLAFFYCKDATMFHELLNTAKNYQPCIIFMEDVDEIGSGTERDSRMNKILNTLDGVQTKNNNLTVIFTTNHEKRINPALRRPGRIDLVVNFQNPDAKSCAMIYQMYLEPLMETYGNEDIDFAKLAEHTGDVPGAVIAEIAKRAVKLCSKRATCSMELCLSAVDSMKHHLELMNEDVEETKKQDIQISIKGANTPS
jgi:hypothetical protein